MNKIYGHIIPVVIILVIVAFLNLGVFLKKPTNDTDNIPKYIEFTKKDVKAGNWDAAHQHAIKLQNAWNIIAKRIQFVAERDEMERLGDDIQRVIGSIEAKDKSEAIIELVETHWQYQKLCSRN